MKPTRGLSGLRLNNLPKERRSAMASLAALLFLLGTLVAYQRFTADKVPAEQAPTPGTATAGVANPSPTGETALTAHPEPTGETPVAAVPPRQLIRPLAREPKILQNYGWTFSTTYRDFRLHPGIEYEARNGEAVLAAAEGKVLSIENDPAEGTVLTLEHAGGMQTRYAGLGKIMVEANSSVEAGKTIGQVGEPGLAQIQMGTRLGFSVYLNGEPVDPSHYLTGKN